MNSETDYLPGMKEESLRALDSVRAPEQIAYVRLCSKLAECFHGNGKLGKSWVVDAMRFFGGRFSNNARRLIGAAAEIRSDFEVPADPDRELAEKVALVRIAKRLLPAWEKAGVILAKIAKGLE